MKGALVFVGAVWFLYWSTQIYAPVLFIVGLALIGAGIGLLAPDKSRKERKAEKIHEARRWIAAMEHALEFTAPKGGWPEDEFHRQYCGECSARRRMMTIRI